VQSSNKINKILQNNVKMYQEIYGMTEMRHGLAMTARSFLQTVAFGAALIGLTGCAQGITPQARNVNIPAPTPAADRPEGINEAPDSVIYLPLGRDVLVPEVASGEPLPKRDVGPFELRGETLGGALQLILSDIDIPIAFQTDQGLTRTITVTNLKGNLDNVVEQVCSLADLYCSFENGTLVIKNSQTFTVVVPPIGTDGDRQKLMTDIAGSLKAILGTSPVTDASTRTIVYEATNRTAKMAERYFQKLRSNTALIVYETYVWEVSLNSGNSTGIKWNHIQEFGVFNAQISLAGTPNPSIGSPISIGLPTKGEVNLTTGDVFKFISNYGAVKTISQPQLTMLSGSKARLRVADKQNYVSGITRTLVDNQTTVSTSTDSVDTGFTLEIASNWDDATVYGDINILLQEVRKIDTFDDNPDAIVQLPQTTERELQTQVRVRPGDSLLIAGLVREVDSADSEGLGVEKPIIPTSRTLQSNNVELVFLLKPRVLVFTDDDRRYERAPVNGDIPLKAVELRKGDQQASLPVVKKNQPDKNARVFDSSRPVPEPVTPKPVELVPETPLPVSESKNSSPSIPALLDEPIKPAMPSVDAQPLPEPPKMTPKPTVPKTTNKVAAAKVVTPSITPVPVDAPVAAKIEPLPVAEKIITAAPVVATPPTAALDAAPAPTTVKWNDRPSTEPTLTAADVAKRVASQPVLSPNASDAQKAEAAEKASMATPIVSVPDMFAPAPATVTSKSASSSTSYRGPIAPSYTKSGPAVGDVDAKGQKRPDTVDPLGDYIVPAPALPSDKRSTSGGAL
jgi:hypothetical protein